MPITFSAKITFDGLIQLPDQYKDLQNRTVTVTISDHTEKPLHPKLREFVGMWEGLTDEDLGLDDIAERRANFFGDRKLEIW